MNKHSIVWNTIVFVILITFGAIAALTGMLVGDRAEPQQTLMAEVLTSPVQKDGELRIKFTVYRNRSCETRVDRFLFDKNRTRYILPALTFGGAPGPVGVETAFIVVIPLPENFGEGAGTYEAFSTYVCNPIHMLWPIRAPVHPVHFVVGSGMMSRR